MPPPPAVDASAQAQAQPTAAPPQGEPLQAAPPQPAPPPQPYAQPPYTPQPYGYAQPQPYGYAQPQPYTYVPGRSHLHDGEVIVDFMTVGLLASIDLVVRQDIDANVGTWMILGGIGGGIGLGYLLDQRFQIDAGAAHATTLGLLLGITNGALLIEPTGYSNGSSIMGLLTAGSALGAAGGFAYGQLVHLDGPQVTFASNVALLGITTAALGSITGSTNSKFGGWEDGTLAFGLDGGALAGLLIAPHLHWSAHRANIVFLSTFVGALAGGLVAGLAENPSTSSNTSNNDVDAAALTAGLWGGFALGILLTRDATGAPVGPVPPVGTTSAASVSTPTLVPWIGGHGETGAMAVGHF
jgi:hypothetical protein